MKAIVANLFFGGIFGCLNYANSAQALPVKSKSTPQQQILSPQLSAKSNVPVSPNLFGFTGGTKSSYSFDSFSRKEYHQWWQHIASSKINIPLQTEYFFPQISSETNCHLNFCPQQEGNVLRPGGANFSKQSINRFPLSAQKPYVHQSAQGDLALGLQKPFWSSRNGQKYWGITTVERWGKNNGQQLYPAQLNYINFPPILALGSSMFTFSGGGNRNLVQSASLDQGFNNPQKFEDFRGGITYHHGVAKHLTMGVGLIYEDSLAGFTQLTYESDAFPLKTTISLLAKESGTDFRIRFQPTPNLVANYYGDSKKQKFELNWDVYPGLTLIAQGNSQEKSYRAGVKISLHNDYLSLNATAAFDSQQNLQWQLNSRLGPVQFSCGNNQDQSHLELKSQLFDSERLGLQGGTFVRYQSFSGKKERGEFMVWGAHIHSLAKANPFQHRWDFELGYGTSSNDRGWIANGTIALQSNLSLKLGYQEMSPWSEATKLKLQLSSN